MKLSSNISNSGFVLHPNRNDVISCNSHYGDLHFRRIISKYIDEFFKIESSYNHNDCSFELFEENLIMIVDAIILEVQTMSPPGRFLEKDHNSDYWREISNYEAAGKVLRALQEGESSRRISKVTLKPSKNDIIFSDPKHNGTLQFLKMIGDCVNHYDSWFTICKKKEVIVTGILHRIKTMNPPGRFLERDRSSGYLCEMEYKRTIEMVEVALRRKLEMKAAKSKGVNNEYLMQQQQQEERKCIVDNVTSRPAMEMNKSSKNVKGKNMDNGELSDTDYPFCRGNSMEDHPMKQLLLKVARTLAPIYEIADTYQERPISEGWTIPSRKDILSDIVKIMAYRVSSFKEKKKGSKSMPAKWVEVHNYEDRLRKAISNKMNQTIQKNESIQSVNSILDHFKNSMFYTDKKLTVNLVVNALQGSDIKKPSEPSVSFFGRKFVPPTGVDSVSLSGTSISSLSFRTGRTSKSDNRSRNNNNNTTSSLKSFKMSGAASVDDFMSFGTSLFNASMTDISEDDDEFETSDESIEDNLKENAGNALSNNQSVADVSEIYSLDLMSLGTLSVTCQ